MLTGKKLLDLKQTLAKGEKLNDNQVKNLAILRRNENKDRAFMPVAKVNLNAGEEVMDFVWMMYEAVQTNRIILADGSLDARLQGIYDDHVIVQDGNTGKYFKSKFTRNVEGDVEFGDPIEVVMQWVPVGDNVSRSVAKNAPQNCEIMEIKKRDLSDWGFLPDSLRR